MGLLLAFAGVGAAMQLDRGESKRSLIRVSDVSPAAVDKAMKSARAKLKGQKLKRLLKGGNRPALLRYLSRNFGVDPKRVVIQNGARNYAGPKCPGKVWNCTRARQVVQYSLHDNDDNGSNRFKCSSSYGGGPYLPNDSSQPTLVCFVVQIKLSGGNNSAECIQQTNSSPTVTQFCDIQQFTANGSNRATIRQGVNRKDTGTEQEVLQEALLDQTTLDGNNRADIDQDVRLVIRGSSPQEQDAHQLVDAEMETDEGNNTANVDQDQDLEEHATGAVVQQLQNTDFDRTVDCADEEPLAPNSCAEIDMTTIDGNNRLDLDQENNLDMTVRGGGDDDDDDDDDNISLHNGDDDDDDDDNGGSGSVTGFEQQGSCAFKNDPETLVTSDCIAGDEADGGTEASINMFSLEDGSTISHMTGLVKEDMPKNQPGITQLQFGDPWCCFGTFFLGDPARSNIDLEVDQDAGDDAYQDGQNGVGCVAAEPDGSDGTCSARLKVSNNEGAFVVEAEGQAIFGRQDCESGPTVTTPVDPDCDDAATVVTVTTATIPSGE